MITKKEAKRLSLLKWNWFYKNPDKTYDDIPRYIWEQIHILNSSCGLCEYDADKEQKLSGYKMCRSCIIKIKNKKCNNPTSLYIKFVNGDDPKKRKEYAKKIIDLIKTW